MLYVLILILGVFSRLIVHIPNFTPIIALSLLSGVYSPKKYSLLLPLILMVISDAILGFHDTIFFTWGSVLLIAGFGLWVRKYRRLEILLGASVVSAFLFFLITNFGAWPALYPKTWEGLAACYIAAIPFFRMELLSTVLYTGVIVSVYEFAARQVRTTRLANFWLSA